MRPIISQLIIISILCILTLFTLCNYPEKGTTVEANNDISGELIIFHAGSMAVPVKEISEAFKKEYPDVKILTESAGSVSCARKITDLNKICDVFISADYDVINTMLIPQYAEWNIKFAGNEMALVYNEHSKYNNNININNWHEIILRDDVRIGRSEPDADPCGYRTIITLKLAEKYYKTDNLLSQVLIKDRIYIRPKEVDLLALLETQTVDYIFLYKSVAVQHKLKYLTLPDEINLKNDGFSDLYSTADVQITDTKPGIYKTIKGEPMAYGITIPKNAPNEKAALVFVNYLLSTDKGMSIMESNGQTSLLPSFSETYKYIPSDLKRYAKNEK